MANSVAVTDMSLETEEGLGGFGSPTYLNETDVRQITADALGALTLTGKKVLLIVPDSTRTAPVGLMFRTINDLIGGETAALDVMIALGTHPPMSDDAINRRLEISAEERASRYGRVRYLNHAWDDPGALVKLGTISAAEIGELSGGLFEMDVDVTINRAVFDYDQLIIVGPVFPHEVVGFSGGNKYLFPGISGPEILNFFSTGWVAVITNPKIIGHKWTPVRKVVDRAGAMVPIAKLAFCMVVHQHQLAGLFAGSPEEAWSQAADLSAKVHIEYKEHPFHTVLSCAPAMYDDLWVGGKCMYKLEPVVADGGELIIYAPHIHEVSSVHGALIERIGYHTRDYFLKQWDKFKDESCGVSLPTQRMFAASERTRTASSNARAFSGVTLATGIPEDITAAKSTWGTGTRRPFASKIMRDVRMKAFSMYAERR